MGIRTGNESTDKYVLHGPKISQEIRKVSFGQLVYESLLRSKRRDICMIDAHTKETINYGQILEKSVLVAQSLRKCGYGKDTKIAICSENNIQFFPCAAATFFIGAVLVPLNHLYTVDELVHAANISKPEVIFCSKQAFTRISALREKLDFIKKIIVINTESLSDFIQFNCAEDIDIENFKTTEINNIWDQTCLIMCSSGTTGLPKGVMISHGTMNARYSAMVASSAEDTDGPVWLALLPFFHTYGLFICLISIVKNKKLIILKKFEPNMFLKTIQDYKINVMQLVPTIVTFLAKSPLVDKYNLTSIKSIACGGAPLDATTESLLQKRFGNVTIFQAYGLTETALTVTKNVNDNLSSYKEGSCGKLIPGMSLKIVSPETKEVLGPYKAGEICCRGPFIMKGYYNNEEATRDTIIDGWLHTGDLGYYDKDECLFIVDRLKELIKYNGFQVSPSELEAVLKTHPNVLDAAVTSKPDEECDELPLAFVVKKPSTNVTEKEIEDFVAGKVSPQKKLRGGVYFIDSIPKNASGKILRRVLKEYFKNLPSKL